LSNFNQSFLDINEALKWSECAAQRGG